MLSLAMMILTRPATLNFSFKTFKINRRADRTDVALGVGVVGGIGEIVVVVETGGGGVDCTN